MKRSPALIGLMLMMILGGCAGLQAAEWPMYRHDSGLTGRSEAKGTIASEPEILGELDLTAVRQTFLVRHASAGGGTNTIDVTQTTAEPNVQWTVEPPKYDLRGDGKLVTRGQVPGDPHLVAKILKDSKGMQTIKWHDFNVAEETAYMEMHDHSEPGEPRLVWKSSPLEAGVYEILLLPVDVNNDGQTDVAFATHYRIAAYDGATGERIFEVRPPIGRNYGLFGYTYIEGDPSPKFFTIVDFQSHFDVYGLEDGQWQVLWRQDVENPEILRVRKIIRVGPRPAVDLFGDGRKQLVFNYHHPQNDNQWHVMGYDLLTGEVILDLPQAFLEGVEDIDGDGHEELFVKTTFGLKNKAPGELRIYKNDGGEMKPIWTLNDALWVTHNVPFRENIFSIATDAQRNVMVGEYAGSGRKSFFAIQPEAPASQRLLGFTIEEGNKIEPSLEAEFDDLVSLDVTGMADVDGDGSSELRVEAVSRKPIVQVRGNQPVEKMSEGVKAGTLAPAIVVDRPDDPPLIAIPTLGGQYAALEFKDGAFNELWRREGTGMPGNSLQMYGLGAADLDGSGRKSIVAVGKSDKWEAQIVTCDLEGNDGWVHTFPEFDAEAPIWNIGGLTHFYLGRYAAPDRSGVLVSLRRSIMHSDEGHMLDGLTGEETWSHDGARAEKSYGSDNVTNFGFTGAFAAAADVDGDGLQEMVTTYPCNLAVVEGETGELSVGLYIGDWAFYSDLMTHDFLNEGKEQILVTSSGNYTLIHKDASFVWQTSHDPKEAPLPAGLADVNGDGALDLCARGFKSDNFRVYSAKTGELLYKLDDPLLSSAGHLSSADIDGDGRDEMLANRDHRLLAVGLDDGSLKLLWSKDFPGLIQLPVIADVDGDGSAEILVSCADGKLYVLGKKGE